MLDKRRRLLQTGDTVLWRDKERGRVKWQKGEVITTGIKYVHVLNGSKRLRLLPSEVERIR